MHHLFNGWLQGVHKKLKYKILAGTCTLSPQEDRVNSLVFLILWYRGIWWNYIHRWPKLMGIANRWIYVMYVHCLTNVHTHQALCGVTFVCPLVNRWTCEFQKLSLLFLSLFLPASRTTHTCHLWNFFAAPPPVRGLISSRHHHTSVALASWPQPPLASDARGPSTTAASHPRNGTATTITRRFPKFTYRPAPTWGGLAYSFIAPLLCFRPRFM
jgi:hypothetical protein